MKSEYDIMDTEKKDNTCLRTDVMLDLETVGLAENAGILSIAMLPFDRKGGETDAEPFFRTVDLSSCFMAGMCMSGSQEWWMRQEPQAVAAIVNAEKHPVPKVMNEAYTYLSAFAEKGELVMWSRGMDFDFPKLEWCFRKFVEKPLPYAYYNRRDVRTLVRELQVDESQIEFEGVRHNALDDCRHQVKAVQKAFACIQVREK